jgi:hypothetical protein
MGLRSAQCKDGMRFQRDILTAGWARRHLSRHARRATRRRRARSDSAARGCGQGCGGSVHVPT